MAGIYYMERPFMEVATIHIFCRQITPSLKSRIIRNILQSF